MQESLVAAIIGVSAAVLFFIALRSIRRRQPESSPAQNNYFSGLSYYLAGDKEMALQRFLDTVRRDTDYVDAYIKIGDIMRELGRTEQASKIHRDLLVRQGLSEEQTMAIYRALAQDYREERKYPQAVEMVDKVVALEKKNPWAMDFKLQLFEEMADWPSAIACANENDHLTKEDKKNRVAFYLLEQGTTLADDKKEHDARLRYREAIKENDELLPAYLELIDSYLRDNRPKAALTILKKITKIQWPFSELVFDRLKQVLFELGLFSDLEQFYSDIESEYPESSEIQLGLAEIYVKKGEMDKAEASCRAALSADADRLDAKLMLADLYLKRGDIEAGSEILAEALEQLRHKQRSYLCGACGFRINRYFYRCPKCHAWDSTQRG